MLHSMHTATAKSVTHMLNDAQQQHMQTMQQVAALLAQADALLRTLDSRVASVALTQLDDTRITVGGACEEWYYEDSDNDDY